jgi:3-oxoacyl-[acyl-carrier-protein] synthase II
MTRITVQGIGVVGGFGIGSAALAQALTTGQSPRSILTVPSGTGTMELSTFRADTTLLNDFVPARTLRRMDQFTKMGLLAAHLALADAGLPPAGQDGLGVIIASGFGATTTTYALLDSIINDGDACTSPTHFANSLHNACSANISIGLGATGPNLTVSQFHLSVPSALLSARQCVPCAPLPRRPSQERVPPFWFSLAWLRIDRAIARSRTSVREEVCHGFLTMGIC